MTTFAKWTYFFLALFSLVGCAPPKNEGMNAFDAAADLRAIQSTQGVTIGWVSGDSLEYFDWLNGMEKRKIPAARAKPSAEKTKPGSNALLTLNIPTTAQDVRVSPSGTSAAYRQTDAYYLATSSTAKPTSLLSAKDVQTPLSWSPNSEYLLFVQLDRGASWRKTIACGGDIHLVRIIRVKDLRQATAFPTCEGFPYWVVQWVHVPRWESDAANNGTNSILTPQQQKALHCIGQAAAQKGLSIALDVAGSIPGFGNLFSGTVEGIQALNAGYYGTVALANAGNTLLNPSVSGAANTAATIGLTAGSLALKGSRVIPVLGTAVSVLSLGYDAYKAVQVYQQCMAGGG